MTRFSRALVLAAIAAAWLSSYHRLGTLPIWSPRDEIAHFDVVARLTNGEIPDSRDDVSADTLWITATSPGWAAPPGFDGSARSLGLAGKSYEAEQPLLYYAILAGLNRSFGSATWPSERILSLRAVTLSFAAAGTLLVVFAANRLDRGTSPLAPLAWIAALAVSVANVDSYSTLGNDSLSVACGGAMFFLAARYELDRADRWIARMSAVAAVAAVLVKASDLLLTIVPVSLAIRSRFGDRGREPSRRTWRPLAPLLAIPAVALTRFALGASSFGGSAARAAFAPYVPGFHDPVRFLRSLLSEAVNLDSLGLRVPKMAGVFLGVALVVAFVDGGWRFVRDRKVPSPLVTASLAVTFATLLSATGLDRWVPGVHWNAFRHYGAVTPFLGVVVSTPVLRLVRPPAPAATP